jgi:hypothetical protein
MLKRLTYVYLKYGDDFFLAFLRTAIRKSLVGAVEGSFHLSGM